MLKALCCAIFCLGAVAQPSGWYEGVDGSMTEPENGPLDKSHPTFVVSIDPDDTKFPAYCLKLKAILYNNTNKAFYYSEPGVMARGFDFEMKNSAGAVVQPSEYFQRLRSQREETMHLPPFEMKPGDFCYHVIDLLKLYDLKPKQTYTIQLWKKIGLDEMWKEQRKISSNTLRFTVPN